MMTIHSKKLRDDQLAAFDVPLSTNARVQDFFAKIHDHFGGHPFRHLDVGGGNGTFSDGLLERFPNCTSTVLDPAQVLLDRNSPNPRKTLVNSTVEEIGDKLGEEKFDLITVNWVLHHLVLGSYKETREHQLANLRRLGTYVSQDGKISVFENVLEGMMLPDLPARAVFGITSSRLLSPITKRLGANTAGTGVCYLSRRQWLALMSEAGLVIDFYRCYPKSVSNRMRALMMLLLARPPENGFFWSSVARS